MAEISKDSIELMQNLVVGVTNDSISKCLKCFSTHLIAFKLIAVYRTIDLDDEMLIRTAEIDDEALNHMLTSELEAIKLSITKATPTYCFSGSMLPAELPRSYLRLRLAMPALLRRLAIHRKRRFFLPSPVATGEGSGVRAFSPLPPPQERVGVRAIPQARV